MRNLVLVAAAALMLTGPGSGARAAGLAEMEARTAAVATRYLAVWSSNEAVADVPYVYGPSVTFYGRTYSQAMLSDEKRRAVQQWPLRRYVHRPGTMRVTCSEAEQKCGARSVMDFTASNPARGTSKHGSARFDLGVSFAGPQPRILWEGGSLNRRRS